MKKTNVNFVTNFLYIFLLFCYLSLKFFKNERVEIYFLKYYLILYFLFINNYFICPPGFFLPLSGGMDSSSTATIVFIMCELVFRTIEEGNELTLNDLRTIIQEPEFTPQCAQDIVSKIFYTCYMGTSNSSEATTNRAKFLSQEIGSNHLKINIDTIIHSMLQIYKLATGKTLHYKSSGGSNTENIALQNIQARLRMVMSYLFAQTLPWVYGKSGSLLVLGSSNVDESLRGYMTKYDCSSADLNPIGSICKTDLRRFLHFASKEFSISILNDISTAVPTAELEPEESGQTDEEDMGMTYDELSVFGKLRKIRRCGPFSMFQCLLHDWKHIGPLVVADKVKRFFLFYSINRHKMTVITPSYHAEAYSPDDNRFDLRQFLYPRWDLQFRCIDNLAQEIQTNHPSRL